MLQMSHFSTLSVQILLLLAMDMIQEPAITPIHVNTCDRLPLDKYIITLMKCVNLGQTVDK